MKKTILISIIVLVTLGATGMFFANRVFDMLFESSISDLQLEPAQNISTESAEVPVKANGDESAAQVKEEVPTKAAKGNISENEKNIDSGQIDNKTNALNSGTNSNTGKTSNLPIVPAADPKADEQPKPPNAQAITAQSIAAVEKKVSTADKAKAIQIIMSKLSASDISQLEALTKGGMTPAKTAQAKAIVKARITSEDIEELKQLYYKYTN